MVTFETKAKAEKFAKQRIKSFKQLIKKDKEDKKRVDFLNKAIKTVKIRVKKFSNGDKLYFVEGM